MLKSIRPENANLLDIGHGHRMAGELDKALRAATALLEAAPNNHGAALLACMTLIAEGELYVASEAAERLVDAFVRRGDLASAVVAAKVAASAHVEAKPLFDQIASAFGKGSKRLANVSMMPPALPMAALDTSDLEALSGEALSARAQKALNGFVKSQDDRPADGSVGKLPLFATLPPKELASFLSTLTLRDAAVEDVLVAQGEEGREAFVVARGLVQAYRADESGNEVSLAGLGSGAIFGEMALVSDAPRTASVVAIEPTILLVIDRDALESVAAAEPAIARELSEFCRARMVANLLRHSAVLNAVTSDKRDALVSRFTTRSFSAGEALVTKDSDSDGLFLIASGAVQVVGTDEDGGDKIVIANLGPGDVVGEISLVLRRPATADVIALHPTFALELSRARFQEAIKEHPTLLAELYEIATRREEETRIATSIPPMSADAAEDLLV